MARGSSPGPATTRPPAGPGAEALFLPATKFAFLKSSLTLHPQTQDTMFQTRSFFGYYYFYATA